MPFTTAGDNRRQRRARRRSRNCNSLTLTLISMPTGFTVEGLDDQCGGPNKGSAVGTATFNASGNLLLNFTIGLPSSRSVQVSAFVSPANGQGTWTDSAGNRGTFAFFGSISGLPPRPLPAAPFAAGSQGRDVLALTAADVIARTLTLSIPAPGLVTAHASGTFSFGSSGHDMGRCALSTGAAIDFVADALESDGGSTIPTVYGAWGLTRTFAVVPGNVSVNLICDELVGTVVLEYSSLSVTYVPH
jgi:hypothetical protein